jgi:hypothetical protein
VPDGVVSRWLFAGLGGRGADDRCDCVGAAEVEMAAAGRGRRTTWRVDRSGGGMNLCQNDALNGPLECCRCAAATGRAAKMRVRHKSTRRIIVDFHFPRSELN